MLLSILFNYFSGLDIARNLQDKRAAKRSLVFNLIINLAVLGFFKYEGFVLDTLNGILRYIFLIMHCRFRLEYHFIHSRYYPISLMYIGEM